MSSPTLRQILENLRDRRDTLDQCISSLEHMVFIADQVQQRGSTGRPRLGTQCVVEGCQDEHVAKNYCARHYANVLRKKGSTLGSAQPLLQVAPPGWRGKHALCTVEGCQGEHIAKGYCSKHYADARRAQMRAKKQLPLG